MVFMKDCSNEQRVTCFHVRYPKSPSNSETLNSKVLAMLFLICCAKMIDIGISSLELTHIRHSDGPDATVWLFDGNVSYLKGKHVPLFILGLIFCSFALVYFSLSSVYKEGQTSVACGGWRGGDLSLRLTH